ncbi:MAG: ABC transporter ATP-binding protein, partial [Bryobacteraceae bacterium]
MKDLSRLLRYARPYLPALLASIAFMAVVGLSQGLLVKLIPLVSERVLQPHAPAAPAVLSVPHTGINLDLHTLIPFAHNVWTMV